MNQLHPSVAAFKNFVNRHPKLLEEIRKSGRGWQEFYEKWAILDEDDPFWKDLKPKNLILIHNRRIKKAKKRQENGSF